MSSGDTGEMEAGNQLEALLPVATSILVSAIVLTVEIAAERSDNGEARQPDAGSNPKVDCQEADGKHHRLIQDNSVVESGLALRELKQPLTYKKSNPGHESRLRNRLLDGDMKISVKVEECHPARNDEEQRDDDAGPCPNADHSHSNVESSYA